MAKALRKKRANTEAHDEKRLEIIMHCANLFDKVGYHKASMQMLADEVGLGKPTLYHYFKSKSAILYAIHELHMDALLQGLEELSDPSLQPSELLRHSCVGRSPSIPASCALSWTIIRTLKATCARKSGDAGTNILPASRAYWSRASQPEILRHATSN